MYNQEAFQLDQYYILHVHRWMSPPKDWLNLFAVFVSASVCSNIWEVPFVTTLLILMPLNRKLSGEYICELLVLFHRGENKQAPEEIPSLPSLKLIVTDSRHDNLPRVQNQIKDVEIPSCDHVVIISDYCSTLSFRVA